MSSRIDLQGFDELHRQALALGSKATAAVNRALLKGARVIEPAVRANAPRKTGAMANAVTSKNAGTRMAGVTFIGGANGPAYYWRFNEYGTTKMKATPFIEPAKEEKAEAAMQAVGEELKKGLGL